MISRRFTGRETTQDMGACFFNCSEMAFLIISPDGGFCLFSTEEEGGAPPFN